MQQPVIELKGVHRSFRQGRQNISVLQDINFAVNKLEFLCLVGESGCGKTTTGKILCGLLPPSSGAIAFEGENIAEMRGSAYRHFRRSVQIIHQDPYASLNPTHTVYDMLSYPLLSHKLVSGRRGAMQRVGELLEQVDLTPVEDFIDKYPHQLSGGQRQRVSIARALTTEPSIIVADESVSMVDVSIRIGLLQMMMDLARSAGGDDCIHYPRFGAGEVFCLGRTNRCYVSRATGRDRAHTGNHRQSAAPLYQGADFGYSGARPGENAQQTAYSITQRGHPALVGAAAGLLLPPALSLVCHRRLRQNRAEVGQLAIFCLQR